MVNKARLFLVLSGWIATGCSGWFLASSKKGFEATELQRASFDLSCPVAQLDVVELVSGTPAGLDDISKGGGDTVVGVTGCNRKATYKYMKQVGWVAQTASTKQEG